MLEKTGYDEETQKAYLLREKARLSDELNSLEKTASEKGPHFTKCGHPMHQNLRLFLIILSPQNISVGVKGQVYPPSDSTTALYFS